MKKKKVIGLLGLVTTLLLAGCSSKAQTGEETGTKAQEETSSSKEEGEETPKEPIHIATKPMTEQYILGEMLKVLIEEKTDYQVEVTKGIGGGTSNIQPAMEKGDFDLYPEYTSSGWVLVLGHEAGEVPDDEILAKLQEEYEEKFGMTWIGLYGFNNTYAVAVRKDVADEYGLTSCSDLAKVSQQLVFGGNGDYIEREDGFLALCNAYGMNFKEVKDIDIGLKYQALDNKDIDVTNAFTTDAQLSKETIVPLVDDLAFQVNYYCSTVVRQDTLEEYPGLGDVLMLMDGLLSDQEVAELNYQVEVDGREEQEVAKEFLSSKGVL